MVSLLLLTHAWYCYLITQWLTLFHLENILISNLFLFSTRPYLIEMPWTWNYTSHCRWSCVSLIMRANPVLILELLHYKTKLLYCSKETRPISPASLESPRRGTISEQCYTCKKIYVCSAWMVSRKSVLL